MASSGGLWECGVMEVVSKQCRDTSLQPAVQDAFPSCGGKRMPPPACIHARDSSHRHPGSERRSCAQRLSERHKLIGSLCGAYH